MNEHDEKENCERKIKIMSLEEREREKKTAKGNYTHFQ